MKHMNPPLLGPPESLWRALGEIKLPVEANINFEIQRWLTLILGPLNLPVEFLNKLLKSAQSATGRAIQAETLLKYVHIHLLVFVLGDHAQKGQTWGFFRMERIEPTVTENASLDHAIEFYLYLEG
jgi:hypothetical protein